MSQTLQLLISECYFMKDVWLSRISKAYIQDILYHVRVADFNSTYYQLMYA